MSSSSDDDKFGSLILLFFFLLYLITYFPRTNRYRLQNLGLFIKYVIEPTFELIPNIELLPVLIIYIAI